jgi:hypothetical protein
MDDATFTELQVLTLYSQAVSLPLAQLVRAPYHQSRNGLDLGPDFDRLLKHLKTIIENPNILIGPNVSWKTATLDRQPWYNPDAITIILRDRNRYPHLRSALIAFFEGALETWILFTHDVLNNPKLSAATPEQRYMAFRRLSRLVPFGHVFGPLFSSFAPSSRDTQVTLQENPQKHHIKQ